MEIKRAGSQPSGKGQAEYFTGTVRIDPLGQPPQPSQPSQSPAPPATSEASHAHAASRVVAISVTFEPGARTAWHSHPLGQTLIVTAGAGWTQAWGGPRYEIHPGDVVCIPAGEKHWHGATATTAMTHIAIQEKLDGRTADWLEHVSDQQYMTP